MIKTFLTLFCGVLFLAGSSSKTVLAQIPETLPYENVLVHSDKDFYLTGQIIWFKIYITESNSLRLQGFSRNAYAELIGPSGKPVLQARVEIKNGLGSGSFLLPDTAVSGSYALRAYTNLMKENPSSFFIHPLTVINTLSTFDTTTFVFEGSDQPTDPPVSPRGSSLPQPVISAPVTISTDKAAYLQRSAVKVQLEMSGPETSPQKKTHFANVSLSVYKVNELNKRKRHAENLPALFFRTAQNISGKQIFIPEINGFVVVARASDPNGKPVSNVPVLLSLAGKIAWVKWGESDENGLVYFNLKNVYGPQLIMLRPSPEFQENVQVDLLKSFSRFSEADPLKKPSFKRAYLKDIEEMHNELEVTRNFPPAEYGPNERDSTSFYGKPYSTYLLDDYKRFVTMEEVLREYVREVGIRIRNNHYSILVLNKQLVDLSRYMVTNRMMDNFDPLVLIDGIPVTPDQLMKYDPLKVRKLEVFAEEYYLGQNIYYGILSFTTYKGDFAGLKLDSQTMLSEEPGWQIERKFHMPDYSSAVIRNNRIPDFRNVLYWTPQILISSDKAENISFFTGDLTGDFLIEVHGITTYGRIIHDYTTITVNK